MECQVTNPEWTVHDIKRLIGMEFDTDTVQADLPYLNYKVEKETDGNMCCVQLPNGRSITAQEISSYILAVLKAAAEAYLKHDVKYAGRL